MKKKKETQAAAPQQERVKPTKQQRKHHILMLLFVVLFIAAIWVIRYPQNYVNMFVAHYDGTASVLESLKGLKRSDVEKGELLPYQQAFDDWKETHLRDEVSVTADDGVTLKGGLYDAGSDVTVVLLHTFDGSSTDTVYLFADYYARKGYNILLPDGRDHGESGGDVVTYGRDESGDLVRWVELLRDAYGADSKVILHGDTLGANEALAGSKLLQQDGAFSDMLTFVVAESPISNLYDGAAYLMKEQFKLPGFMVAIGDSFAKKPLGSSMKDIDLVEMTEDCTVPLLVIQGDEDTVVDPAAVQSFYDGYAGEKQLILTSGAAHGMAYVENADECERALDSMIQSYVK